MKRKKRTILLSAIVLLCLILLVWAYNLWFARTYIAFVNYQPISLQAIAQANDNGMIRLFAVSESDISKDLKKYDIILVNGMGLRIDAQQREVLEKLAARGVPIHTTMATNPENNISNFDIDEVALLSQWMATGGKKNYRSMLSFLRRNVDGKVLRPGEVLPPEQMLADYLYLPATDKKSDEREFTTVAELEDYLHATGLWVDGGEKIIVTGQLTDPSDLIRALIAQKRYNVYPVMTLTRLMDYVEEIAPSAIVNLAHGRLGDDIVDYLTAHNTLYFDPLTINEEVSTWEDDVQGMLGGFLSQSIVMPEIDGAIRPSVVFAQQKNKQGLLEAYAIPDRLNTYIETINHYFDLRTKDNSTKHIAIVYYKAPGQMSLIASGMEVIPSLYNLLTRLQSEGYNVSGLPATVSDFEQDIYATSNSNDSIRLLQYGNICLLPQPAAGEGDDEVQIAHGTDAAPPTRYIAMYEWIQHDFCADALIHFGTHGSLEFTPRKQVALCSADWPDRLIGSLPHFYLYTIDNVGEAMTAKRRTYAQIISHLTPPFHPSVLTDKYRELTQAIRDYHSTDEPLPETAQRIQQIAQALDLLSDLRLPTDTPLTHEDIERLEDYAEELLAEKVWTTPYILGQPYANTDIETSVYAITTDPIAYGLYSLDRLLGRTTIDFSTHRTAFEDTYTTAARRLVAQIINSSTTLSDTELCNIAHITAEQLTLSREVIAEENAPRGMLAMMLAMSRKDSIDHDNSASGMATMMKMMSSSHLTVPKPRVNPISKLIRHEKRKMLAKKDPSMMLKVAKRMGASDDALKKMEKAMSEMMGLNNDSTATANTTTNDSKYTTEETLLAHAIDEVVTALTNVTRYRTLLKESPQGELASICHALNGGYTPPSSGGDVIVNPRTLPTGRNLYAINAEETPSVDAWERGTALAQATIDEYRQTHDGDYPRKVSFTLWSSEFIQTGGATLAQAFFLLGVEPIRDRYNRISDIRLIPDDELNRPRIDILVQTSGQLRELAASRLTLLSRAVHMAAEAPAGDYPNFVREGIDESEHYMVEAGIAPKEARRLSYRRVFGGVNGAYGTGIQAMIDHSGDWDDRNTVAQQYIENMSGYYGDADDWEDASVEAFRAALTRTDVVVQPRQSNTWGALSLDHVYEFMGGLNLAVAQVTGSEPEAYLSDYRNRNAYKSQEVTQAIAVESRTKLLNEAYISESLHSGRTPTDALAEMVRNAYGWTVMKQETISDSEWNEIFNVYVNDTYSIDILDKFADSNPMALLSITATMQEAARKGYWHADEAQLARLATVHTDFSRRFGASTETFELQNAKLQDFIAQHATADDRQAYRQAINEAMNIQSDSKTAITMQKETQSLADERSTALSATIVVAIVIVALIVIIALLYRRRMKNREQE